MRACPLDRDSETQYYTLINKYAGRDLETDICNECMHKLIDFVKAPSVVPQVNKNEWVEEFSDDGWRWVKDEL